MRLAVFYLFLFLTQSFWGAWLAPYPAPDLFLIAMLTFLWRVPPWQLVLIGYGIGLVQDLFGYGHLGLHALGVAGGAMAAILTRAQLSQSNWLERGLVVLAALLGKWLTLIPFVIWQSGTFYAVRGVAAVVPLETLFTLLFALWLLPWGEALMERTRLLRKELL